MTREEKAQIIDVLTEKFNQHEHFYVTDASGLSVAQINDFRRACYKNGIEYGVYKNTLIKKALEKRTGSDYSELTKVLHGFSGLIFSKEVANLPAKVIREVQGKLNGKPVLKAAWVDSDFYIGNDSVTTLADLKSKEELIGEIISMLQAPIKNVISALKSGEHKIAGLVKTLESKAK